MCAKAMFRLNRLSGARTTMCSKAVRSLHASQRADLAVLSMFPELGPVFGVKDVDSTLAMQILALEEEYVTNKATMPYYLIVFLDIVNLNLVLQ